MVGQGLGAPVYGTYLDATAVILFEHNDFTAWPLSPTNPLVGSTFKDIGPSDNVFFDNRYDGFGGGSGPLLPAGVTIQGNNDGPGIGDGLRFRCNEFSKFVPNTFDMAFTGPNVSVGDRQGSGLFQSSPAGNTFLLNCTGNEEHMKVDDVPNNLGLYFQYWHHAPTFGVEVVPTCLTDPPLSPVPFTGINQPTGFQFVRAQACVGASMMLLSGGGSTAASEAAYAANERQVLKAVYDDWTDGGDTEGLKEFVLDPTHDSYAVRNQLMLVAPKVSDDIWDLVFKRVEDMNPWHLAQALIANSPLEPPVMAMLENSTLIPYYKQLVANEQGGGMSMQMIKESELSYWRNLQTQALMAYTSGAFDEFPSVTFTEAIALHQQYPVEGSAEEISLLHIANGDLAAARAGVNAALASDHTAWWDIQDMYLSQLESGLEMDELSLAQEAQLVAIADTDDPASSRAKAWLLSLDQKWEATVILPSTTRSMHQLPQSGVYSSVASNLAVHPNPSQGEAYVTYSLPEGMQDAELQVFDATGRMIWHQGMGRRSGIAELPSGLPPGMYQAALRGSGVLVGSVKFTIVR